MSSSTPPPSTTTTTTTLHYLRQWTLTNLNYSATSTSYHSLATATLKCLPPQTTLPAYNPNLPNPAALRCVVSALSRYLQNDKFPGWSDLGTWNFCACVEGGDVEAGKILLTALKRAREKTERGRKQNEKRTPPPRSPGTDCTTVRGDDREPAGDRPRHTISVSVESRALREVHKSSQASTGPRRRRPRRLETERAGKGPWDEDAVIARPQVPSRSKSALEKFERSCAPQSPRPVHGRRGGPASGGWVRGPTDRETSNVHASPNHRNSEGKGYGRRLKAEKGKFFNDDEGTFRGGGGGNEMEKTTRREVRERHVEDRWHDAVRFKRRPQ